MCLYSCYHVDGFCWFLAVSLIHYTYMYGLIYLSRLTNLSYITILSWDRVTYASSITVYMRFKP